MNVSDSIVFAALGCLMEALPRVFPSWFPHAGSDLASNRELWTELMGAVQIALGAAMILTLKVVPVLRSALAAAAGAPAQVPAGAAPSAARR